MGDPPPTDRRERFRIHTTAGALVSTRELLPMYGVVEELILTTEKGAVLLVGGS
jgi:hypothetical protein